MDGHRDADANVEGVEDGDDSEPAPVRKEGEDGNSHGKGGGSMRGGPAPEYSAAHETETEDVTGIYNRDMM